MITKEEIQELLHSTETYRVERTISTGDMDKFQEAICAFANDMPNSRKKGYLILGAHDNGELSGLKVTDDLLKKIAAIRSNGNILPTFDTRPCREASIDDIDTDIIIKEYMPRAIAPDVLESDNRPLKEQLAALHLFNLQADCPTFAAVIMFGRNPKFFMHGAYIQYVHFRGKDNGGEILNERRFEGSLYKVLPELENFLRDGVITKRPVPISILREKDVVNYPFKALRELMMNALMHRDYQSNMPTRLYQYDDFIEIMNPGGLYGQARPENFPLVNDYRNSVVAEMMKTLNYVNMFNHGVNEVRHLLKDNNSPEPEFNVNLMTAFSVIVREPKVEVDVMGDGNLSGGTTQKTTQKTADIILEAIKNEPTISRTKLAGLCEISPDGVK